MACKKLQRSRCALLAPSPPYLSFNFNFLSPSTYFKLICKELANSFKILWGNCAHIPDWSVIFHVAFNKLARCNGRHQWQLPSQYRTGHYGCQEPWVGCRGFSACTLNTEQIQACRLRSKLSPTTNSTNLDKPCLFVRINITSQVTKKFLQYTDLSHIKCDLSPYYSYQSQI